MTEVRRPFFGANWKMHKTPAEARAFLRAFRDIHGPATDRTVVFFPPSISVPSAREAAGGRSDLEIGVQDVHQETEGAHTGAISAAMAAAAGASWGLAGHSERRREFGDPDERVAAKVRRLLEADLAPVLCVGETLEERDRGELEAVLERQVAAVLDALDEADHGRLVYAYEPVWAIGTGESATAEDAAEAHGILRTRIAERTDPAAAEESIIIYGGSVKPHNVDDLLTAPGVDGALVGSASLDPIDFAGICGAATGEPAAGER